MKHLLAAASVLAAATTLPTAAFAQSVPDAKVGVVNTTQLATTCNACVTANAQLEAQAQVINARQQELQTALNTEAQAINTQIEALPEGAEPSAELSQRVQAFEIARAAANREIEGRDAALARNQQYVLRQINVALAPVWNEVLTARGLSVLMRAEDALAFSPSIDVTADVLQRLNTRLTTLQTVAPPPQQPGQAQGQQPAQGQQQGPTTPQVTPQPQR
ncbi:OmpH family outer membrane protein [Sphingomicrobium sediminis]|uniref:OmpH family outer membrane protein n=1 Tax=Sphingomicrobium sediminis TaxID=2950949 RepID=A0A9X2EHG4_9SPHN|nr:OmpH family outer membrane protein [Sphingomicrobium sediminis]MCM8556756.1 OmpH family outer membrane protein [Sphingomicrobium sediminis]